MYFSMTRYFSYDTVFLLEPKVPLMRICNTKHACLVPDKIWCAVITKVAFQLQVISSIHAPGLAYQGSYRAYLEGMYRAYLNKLKPYHKQSEMECCDQNRKISIEGKSMKGRTMEEDDDAVDDLDDDRSKRYVECNVTTEFSKSSNFNKIKPYFEGDHLSERMGKIRETITHIRENWDKYDDFMSAVVKFSESVGSEEVKQKLISISKSRRDWAENIKDISSDFDTIRLYTSVKGYNEIFSLINRVFRDEQSTSRDEEMLLAVFFIELMNIDLFNYCIKNKAFNNFTGIVYRGMAVVDSDFQAFVHLRSKEISQRYIATPLSLISTSTSQRVATSFIKRELKDNSDRKPMLMKIYVTELDPEYLEFYRRRFPSSVVSTICAVDIKDLSLLPREKEVLLRGPFFQILNISDGDVIQGQTCKVLEMVMLNTNRDHISTMQLGADGAPARELFGNMVAATRCKFAVRYYDDRGLHADAEDYRKILKEKEDRLQILMAE